MADSTVIDVSKIKVVDLRKELKSRGLDHSGDKSALVTRLQEALAREAQDDHGDINLDSDEDLEGVLDEDDKSNADILDDDDKSTADILDDDKSNADILDDTAATLSDDGNLSEDLVIAEQVIEKPVETKTRTLKRKIVENVKPTETKTADKDAGSRKIVLNRTTSVTATVTPKPAVEAEDTVDEDKPKPDKVKITAGLDPKARLELRAKRFGLPVKMTDDVKKEARKHRFGNTISTAVSNSSNPELSENLEKLKKRADRFGESVSKLMIDVENKEKLEKRKAKFGSSA